MKRRCAESSSRPLDYRLLMACQVPLHLVAEATNPLPLKVAAALDIARPELISSGGLNDGIIDAARNLASLCGAELHFLHACDLPSAIDYDSATLSSSWDSSHAEQVRISLYRTFNHLADRWHIPMEHRHFVLGPATQGIANFMDDHRVDVVVMDMQSRLELDRILGSSTERLLYRISGGLLAVGADTTRMASTRYGVALGTIASGFASVASPVPWRQIPITQPAPQPWRRQAETPSANACSPGGAAVRLRKICDRRPAPRPGIVLLRSAGAIGGERKLALPKGCTQLWIQPVDATARSKHSPVQ